MKDLITLLNKTIATVTDDVITIRQRLHAHPELSGAEMHTRDTVASLLEKANIQVKTFDDNYGLIANIIVDPHKPFIALRADMDALPIDEKSKHLSYASQKQGVMHACGHDAHTAILLGCALSLNAMKSHLSINVRFIFQPSEEIIAGGSSQMIADGALSDVKAIFGLHAYPYLKTGTIGYKRGVMLASADMFEIEIFGKSAHGARPHEGVDAILLTSMIVNSLNHIVSRQIDPIHPAVISLGTIEGGKAANVICDHVTLKGTVRTVNHDIRQNIPKMMQECIAGNCHSMKAQYKFHYDFGMPEVNNTTQMVDALIKGASCVLEEKNIVDLIDPVMGGEDFGRYLEKVPGAFFRLGTCNDAKETCHAQHNNRFNVDDDALVIGMKVLCATVLTVMSDVS